MINNTKYNTLIAYLKKLGNAAVAFSGGVDSTFLLFAAKEALGEKVIALTVDAPYIAGWEIEEAKEITNQFNIKHQIIKVPFIDTIKYNPENRCYLCKKAIFSSLQEITKRQGFTNLLDGTNSDDMDDFRPGLKALKELQVISPLRENGLTKEDIRAISKELSLPTWDKPPYACLLTRIPFDHEITLEEIERIEKAEKYLIDLGFKFIRVRSHGNLARIEINREKLQSILEEEISDKIYNKLKELGFSYVTIDILGYRMGSMNKTCNK